MSNKLDELIDNYNTKKKEMESDISKQIEPIFKEFFERDSTLIAIKFEGYVPYFNDGEPCTYGVHEPYFKFNDVPEDEGGDSDGYVSSYDLNPDSKYNTGTYKSKQRYDLAIEIAKLLHKIPEEILQNIYGSHTRFTVTKDGIQTEDYDHD